MRGTAVCRTVTMFPLRHPLEMLAPLWEITLSGVNSLSQRGCQWKLDMNFNLSGGGTFMGEACSVRKVVGAVWNRTERGHGMPPRAWPRGQLLLCRMSWKTPGTVVL